MMLGLEINTKLGMIGDLDTRHDTVPIIKVPDSLPALTSRLWACHAVLLMLILFSDRGSWLRRSDYS